MQSQINESNKMKDWALGRINFSLSDQFELSGRSHNIYYVNVSTTLLGEQTPKDILNKKIKLIKEKNINLTNTEGKIEVIEIEPNFNAIFYQDDPSASNIIKLDAHRIVDKISLEMSFEGKLGKEKDMLRGLTIIANSYLTEIPYGFNIGEGSITSTPGLNEYARAKFIDKKNSIDLNISTHVATENLNKHPLHDIDDEIKGLIKEGIILQVITNNEKTVAGFNGHEALITLNHNTKEPQFRYTWFTPGVKADSFKPEILIKVYGPLENIDKFKDDWDHLLNSITVRSLNK